MPPVGTKQTVTPRKLVANHRNGAKGGRPVPRINADLIANVSTAIRAGVRPEVAAVLNGIPRRVHYDWMDRAQQPGGRNGQAYRDYSEAVELALAEWEANDILLLGKHAREDAPGKWMAAAWRLERRLPTIYGQKKSVEVDHTVQLRPMIDAAKLTLDEQWQLRELLAKGSPDQVDLPKDGQPAVLALGPGEPVAA